MRRLLLLLILLALPALPAAAQSSSEARVTQVDTSHYPDVTVYVSVISANGKPVAGLKARDFTITEDGQPVTIDRFVGGGASPISTVLVIDRSGSMGDEDKLEGAQDAARAFVDQMRPGDQTAVLAFDEAPELLQPFTSDTERLDRSIRRIQANGPTALYDSLIAGVDTLDGADGRRALLLLTDGRDCVQMPCDEQASRASLDQAIASAVKDGIAVQAIGLGERGTDDMSSGIDEAVLQRIAGETGGAYFYAPSADQLAGLYRQLSSNMQQEYALTYRSPRPFYDGTRRNIEVHPTGAAPAPVTYVESHLIQVRSDPLVGLLLLLPILGLLLLPSLRRRSSTPSTSLRAGDHRPPTTEDRGLRIEDSNVTASESRSSILYPPSSTIVQPPGITVVPGDVPRCQACDAPLLGQAARFCSACGASQAHAQPEPAQRIFCDQCGRPMRPSAHFCSTCGASAPIAWPQTSQG